MKELVEYTTKNLYGEFKPEEICFVVEVDYDCINELSYITDKLDDALSKAKENDDKIFVYSKYFDNTYWIPYRLLGTLRTDAKLTETAINIVKLKNKIFDKTHKIN